MVVYFLTHFTRICVLAMTILSFRSARNYLGTLQSDKTSDTFFYVLSSYQTGIHKLGDRD